MSLFFDAAWFDARLAQLGLSRSDLGRALGLDEGAVRELFKDQRELSARDVGLIAALLAAPAEEIANRAGISTPVPKPAAPCDPVLERLAAIERELVAIKALLQARKP